MKPQKNYPFECTINGETRQFETAKEMAEWRERMLPVLPQKKLRHKKHKPKNNKPNMTLQEYVKKNKRAS